MQEFNHIEAIWARHQVDIKISADEMLKQAKKEVGSVRTRGILNIMGMVLSLLSLSALWLAFDFNSIYTHLGISIIIISIILVTIILYRNHRIIAKTDFTLHPTEFITHLKKYEINQYILYHKLYWIYLTAISLGLILLLVDLNPLVQLIVLVVCFGWLVFCSTILRKAFMKRDKEQINLLIEKLTKISGQF